MNCHQNTVGMLDGCDLEYRECSSNTCCKMALLANRFVKCCQFCCQQKNARLQPVSERSLQQFQRRRIGQCIAKYPEGFSKLWLQESFETIQKQRLVDSIMKVNELSDHDLVSIVKRIIGCLKNTDLRPQTLKTQTCHKHFKNISLCLRMYFGRNEFKSLSSSFFFPLDICC